MEPNKVDEIVKAACILHNYVRKNEGKLSEPTYTLPTTSSVTEIEDSNQLSHSRPTNQAIRNRDKFTEYFLKTHGELPWQYHEYFG